MEKYISIDDLLVMLELQKKLYIQLSGLAQSQFDLIENNTPEALLRVLADRQKLLSKITKVDNDLKIFKQNRDEILSQYSAAERDRINILLGEIEAVLCEVLENDQRDAQLLSGKKDQVANEIKKTKSGSRYNKAYAASYGEQQKQMFDSTSG